MPTADTARRMPGRALALPYAAGAVLLGAVTLAGCGAGGDGEQAAARPASTALRPWHLRAPYLPPPDPSTLRRPAPRAAVAKPSAAGTAGTGAGGGAGAGRVASATAAPSAATASGAPSDAQVAAELRQAYGGKGGDDLDQAAIDSTGLAIIPPTAPAKLVALMQGANEVARKPYVYGGGHGRNPNEIWTDSAYDCSGSVSYALAAAGYLDGPVDSSTLMRFGKPGPGRWVTIYANAVHTFMVVAGLRFDTSGRQITGTRWQSANGRSYAGFAVRHPPGL